MFHFTSLKHFLLWEKWCLFDLESLFSFNQQCDIKNFIRVEAWGLKKKSKICDFCLFLLFVYGSVLERSLVMLVLHLNNMEAWFHMSKFILWKEL